MQKGYKLCGKYLQSYNLFVVMCYGDASGWQRMLAGIQSFWVYV